MPVERTENRGADELYRYYEVYETIGSGNVNVSINNPLCRDIFTLVTFFFF